VGPTDAALVTKELGARETLVTYGAFRLTECGPFAEMSEGLTLG
jgi:hypothetical protein